MAGEVPNRLQLAQRIEMLVRGENSDEQIKGEEQKGQTAEHIRKANRSLVLVHMYYSASEKLGKKYKTKKKNI